MSTAQKVFNVLIVVALVAFAGLSVSKSANYGTTGASYNPLQEQFGGGLIVGNQGSALAQVIDTTCTGIAYGSLAASSSRQMDCAVAGVLPGDRVQVDLPLAANIGPSYNFDIGGQGASSTAGYVSYWLNNMTGAATSSYSQATTSVHVSVFR
jgi:hypothetical protein